jgi:hypothetical protein
MRTFTSLVVTVLLLGSLFTQAQGASSSDNTRVQTKGVVLSGQLSSDGKKLLADDDNEWIVSNADAVKGLEGRYVSVRCRMNPKGGTIRVLSIADQPATNYAAHYGDAAFRR